VNDRCDHGETALIIATRSRQLPSFSLLLADPRVDADATDVLRKSALSMAAACGCGEFVTLLLNSRRLDLRHSGGHAVVIALSGYQMDIATALLARPDLAVNEDCQFWHRNGFLHPTDEVPMTPLIMAVGTRGPGAVVQVLAHPRFDPGLSDVPAAILLSLSAAPPGLCSR
jgi:ankyrin repeat protein